MYKFNNGDGAIVCDICLLIYSSTRNYEGLDTLKRMYSLPIKDICPACRVAKDLRKKAKRKK